MKTDVQEPLIFIVDDNKDLREIVGTKLKANGFRIEEAENGSQALEKLKTIKPDLVILDVQMPVLGGVETLMRIKADPGLKDLKVVFFTSYGDPQKEAGWIDEKFAREIGAVDYIKKTEDLPKMIEQIKKTLGAV